MSRYPDRRDVPGVWASGAPPKMAFSNVSGIRQPFRERSPEMRRPDDILEQLIREEKERAAMERDAPRRPLLADPDVTRYREEPSRQSYPYGGELSPTAQFTRPLLDHNSLPLVRSNSSRELIDNRYREPIRDVDSRVQEPTRDAIIRGREPIRSEEAINCDDASDRGQNYDYDREESNPKDFDSRESRSIEMVKPASKGFDWKEKIASLQDKIDTPVQKRSRIYDNLFEPGSFPADVIPGLTKLSSKGEEDLMARQVEDSWEEEGDFCEKSLQHKRQLVPEEFEPKRPRIDSRTNSLASGHSSVSKRPMDVSPKGTRESIEVEYVDSPITGLYSRRRPDFNGRDAPDTSSNRDRPLLPTPSPARAAPLLPAPVITHKQPLIAHQPALLPNPSVTEDDPEMELEPGSSKKWIKKQRQGQLIADEIKKVMATTFYIPGSFNDPHNKILANKESVNGPLCMAVLQQLQPFPIKAAKCRHVQEVLASMVGEKTAEILMDKCKSASVSVDNNGHSNSWNQILNPGNVVAGRPIRDAQSQTDLKANFGPGKTARKDQRGMEALVALFVKLTGRENGSTFENLSMKDLEDMLQLDSAVSTSIRSLLQASPLSLRRRKLLQKSLAKIVGMDAAYSLLAVNLQHIQGSNLKIELAKSNKIDEETPVSDVYRLPTIENEDILKRAEYFLTAFRKVLAGRRKVPFRDIVNPKSALFEAVKTDLFPLPVTEDRQLMTAKALISIIGRQKTTAFIEAVLQALTGFSITLMSK